MMLNVTFKQLRAFVVLAREQSFVRAAERLHITPPTLTASIKTLEEALELRLFDRSTRSVVMTGHARAFLPVAQRLLEDLDRALGELRDKVALHTGSVIVTGATSFIAYVLSPAVARLAQAHPGVRVRLNEAATEAARRAVLDGEADFGVTTLHEPDPSLSATRLVSDRFMLACHREHPLAVGKGTVALSELAGHPFVGLSRINGVQAILEGERRLPECARRPAYEVSDVPLLAPLIERGVGLALLPAMATRTIARRGLVFRPLGALVQRHIYFIMQRGRSLGPAAQTLVALMLDELHRMPADATVSVSRSSAALLDSGQ
ncbi:MAG: LysR family transcriptional regulator [Burkholderiales bacterium]|nr:LysR family transcriptional regulator [Burkholderiales bacterium]